MSVEQGSASPRWACTAGYLYALELDDRDLAWEYLRRNATYRAHWHAGCPGGVERWGLVGAEDPDLDARAVSPDWRVPGPPALTVMESPGTYHVPGRRFDLWRIPGRKRLRLRGRWLDLAADLPGSRLRARLSRDLVDGEAFDCLAPLEPGLRKSLDAHGAQADLLAGTGRHRGVSRLLGRSALIHAHCLQALDAVQDGASHREIAEALLGEDVVASRWSPDGELRAQVRYMLRRGREHVDGGYLRLVRGSGPPG